MSPDDMAVSVLLLLSYVFMFAVNTVVAVTAFKGYFKCGGAERSLFWIGASCAIGAVSSAYSATASYLFRSETAQYDAWLAVTLLTMIDMSVFAWAMRTLIRNHIALRTAATGKPARPEQAGAL